MAEPFLNESDSASRRLGRGITVNLVVGMVAGAVAAAIGAATGIVVWGIATGFFIQSAPYEDPSFNLFLGVLCFGGIAALFGGIMGVFAGLLLAIADVVSRKRLRKATFPIWAWFPIGAVLGASSVMLITGFSFRNTALGYLVLFGAGCGFVAGPIFGRLFREPTRGELEVAQ